MIESVIFYAALLFVFVSGQMGMKAGAFPSLSTMVATVLSLLIALRYWFPVSRLACSYETASLLVVATVVFWTIFLGALFGVIKLCESHLETFESIKPSLFGRVVGAVFGCVSGAVIVTTLMMTLTILAPTVLPSYNHSALPLAIDAAPEKFFRLIETQVGRVKADDPSHTRLPDPVNSTSSDPSLFWH